MSISNDFELEYVPVNNLPPVSDGRIRVWCNSCETYEVVPIETFEHNKDGCWELEGPISVDLWWRIKQKLKMTYSMWLIKGCPDV